MGLGFGMPCGLVYTMRSEAPLCVGIRWYVTRTKSEPSTERKAVVMCTALSAFMPFSLAK